MPELILKLNQEQIIEMIDSLKEKEKFSILKFLEEATWGKRFGELSAKLKKQAKGKISSKEILKEVELVRKKRYESRSRH